MFNELGACRRSRSDSSLTPSLFASHNTVKPAELTNRSPFGANAICRARETFSAKTYTHSFGSGTNTSSFVLPTHVSATAPASAVIAASPGLGFVLASLEAGGTLASLDAGGGFDGFSASARAPAPPEPPRLPLVAASGLFAPASLDGDEPGAVRPESAGEAASVGLELASIEP